MRAIDAAKVPPDELAMSLRLCVKKIIRVDGDRDHMNGSDLNCEQTMAMAKIMLAAADKLAPEGATP